jgi:hypothetical protein
MVILPVLMVILPVLTVILPVLMVILPVLMMILPVLMVILPVLMVILPVLTTMAMVYTKTTLTSTGGHSLAIKIRCKIFCMLQISYSNSKSLSKTDFPMNIPVSLLTALTAEARLAEEQ